MESNGTHTKKISALGFEVSNGGHQLVADVSEKLGGANGGMNPHQLLETALAGCTAITLQMYAQRKGWPLESADVQVKVVEEGKETRFTRVVSLRGVLSEEQRQGLLVIANKCPIHKILVGAVTVDTTLG